MDMPEVRIPMETKEHQKLKNAKDGRTWKEMLKDEAGIEE